MRSLFFVRHGESEANLSHEFANRSAGHGLTALGRRQARDLGRQLAGSGITEIYTSPLLRAQQTAEVVGGLLGLSWQIEEALREYDVGVLEGTAGPVQWDQYAEMERDWLLRGRWDRRHRGGESYREVATRFEPFLRGVTPATGSVLAVTHGGLLRLMLPRFVSGLDYRFAHDSSIPNCGVVEVARSGDDLVCRAWCGQSPNAVIR